MSATNESLGPPSLAETKQRRKPVRNVNAEHEQRLKSLERLACLITERVGTMGFFLTIFCWTILWCGYNLLASEVKALHWKPFDPFPAFVAYLLMSNVIQILLMPLIMVGQNIQGKHAEMRAENDYHVNLKAEHEVEVILHHLEYQNALLIAALEKLGLDPQQILTQKKRPA